MLILGRLIRNMYATLRLVACPYFASISITGARSCGQRASDIGNASRQLATARSPRAMLLRFPTVVYFY
jgi:hypothetical protein